jgi:DNA-binding NarL/FixJ family response regulator
VVVVADHQLVADVVVIALANHGFDATSVDISEDGALPTAMSRILDDPPDVLLLDLDLRSHSDDGLFIAPAVRAGVEVVVMTDGDDDTVRALEAGARCLIPKTSPLADLIEALEDVLLDDPLLTAPLEGDPVRS